MHKAELGEIHGLVMNRDTEELTIRWLGRRPMRKEGMNGIGTGDLQNRQPQGADIVIFPVFCKRLSGKIIKKTSRRKKERLGYFNKNGARKCPECNGFMIDSCW